MNAGNGTCVFNLSQPCVGNIKILVSFVLCDFLAEFLHVSRSDSKLIPQVLQLFPCSHRFALGSCGLVFLWSCPRRKPASSFRLKIRRDRALSVTDGIFDKPKHLTKQPRRDCLLLACSNLRISLREALVFAGIRTPRPSERESQRRRPVLQVDRFARQKNSREIVLHLGCERPSPGRVP